MWRADAAKSKIVRQKNKGISCHHKEHPKSTSLSLSRRYTPKHCVVASRLLWTSQKAIVFLQLHFIFFTPPPHNGPEQQTASREKKKKKHPLLAKKQITTLTFPRFPSVQGRACPRADIPPPVVSTDLTGTTEQIRWHLVSTNEEWHVHKSFMLWRAEGAAQGWRGREGGVWAPLYIDEDFPSEKTQREVFVPQIKSRQLLLYIPRWADTLQTGLWYSAMQAPCMAMMIMFWSVSVLVCSCDLFN